jgi:hypothetical protein
MYICDFWENLRIILKQCWEIHLIVLIYNCTIKQIRGKNGFFIKQDNVNW